MTKREELEVLTGLRVVKDARDVDIQDAIDTWKSKELEKVLK